VGGEVGAVAAGEERAPTRSAPNARRAGARVRVQRRVPAARLLPPWRVLAAGWIAVAAAAGAYAIARETPIFAISRIQVAGAPAPVAAAVSNALASYRGRSLVGLDGGAVLGRLEALPAVYRAHYDRAFPNTLRIFVRAERPVGVLRAGPRSWLVAADARVLAVVPRRSDPELPRIWVPADTPVTVGATLGGDAGGAAARAIAPLARSGFPARVAAVSLVRGELRFALAGGLEVRLGQPDDLRLKLAIARRILGVLPAGTTYLDLSVPERPVSGVDPQVSGRA
jgi:cell division protein FtsQ